MSSPTVETLKFQHAGVAYVATYDSRDAERMRGVLQSGRRVNVRFRYDVHVAREDGKPTAEQAAQSVAAEFIRKIIGYLQSPGPTLH